MTNHIFLYNAFGLSIGCDFPIPELEVSSGPADIRIRYGETPKALVNPSVKMPRFEVSSTEFLLNMDGIASYYVREGKEITVNSYPKATEEDIRVILLGSVLAALFHQRHMLVLHGSAVVVNGEGVIFSGISGTGKSTIAVLLEKKGYHILTDDLCVIRTAAGELPSILPGFPWLKLWKDALPLLGTDDSGLIPIRNDVHRYLWNIKKSFHRQAVPVSRIYILKPKKNQGISINRLDGFEKAGAVLGCTYRRRFVEAQGCLALNLNQCTQVANTSQVYNLTWSMDAVRADDLAEWLEQEMKCQ